MPNIHPDLMIKMPSGNKKKLCTFPDFSCMHRRMCVHVHYTPARENRALSSLDSWQEKQLIGSRAKLCTGNILLLTKNRQSVFFCLQQFSRKHKNSTQDLCLNVSTPLTFCAFFKLTPQNQASQKIVPPLTPAPLQAL